MTRNTCFHNIYAILITQYDIAFQCYLTTIIYALARISKLSEAISIESYDLFLFASPRKGNLLTLVRVYVIITHKMWWKPHIDFCRNTLFDRKSLLIKALSIAPRLSLPAVYCDVKLKVPQLWGFPRTCNMWRMGHLMHYHHCWSY